LVVVDTERQLNTRLIYLLRNVAENGSNGEKVGIFNPMNQK